MLELLFYSLAAFGLAYIVGHARVSLGVREWMAGLGLREEWRCSERGCEWRRADPVTAHDPFFCPHHPKSALDRRDITRWYHRLAMWLVMLIECPACFGFWIGLTVGHWYPYVIPVVVPGPSAALALGLYTCAVGYVLGRATGWLKEE